MKSRFLLIATVLLLVAAACKKTETTESPTNYSSALQYSTDTMWQSFTKPLPNRKGGIGVYIVCPKGSYFSSSGLESGASTISRFRAASITKSFTAAAIMLLDQQGKLDIEDKLTDLIPGTSRSYLPDDTSYQIPYKDRITIRELLMHRANVFDLVNSRIPDTVQAWYAGQFYYMAWIVQKDRYHQFTLDELHRLISKHQLTYGEPGIEHHYSNNGYTLLAKIIERVTGMPYEVFINFEIFERNQLLMTSLPALGTDTALPAPFLHGYRYDNGNTTDFTMFNMSWGMGEGNLITTFRDISLFYRRLFKGLSGVNSAQVARMMECPVSNDNYGLGVEFRQGLGYGHTGSHFGYITLCYYDPVTDCMVVSECTLYPGNEDLNKALGNSMVNLLLSMRKTLGY